MGTLCSKPRLRNHAGVSSQVAWEFLNWSALWFSPKSSVFPVFSHFFFAKNPQCFQNLATSLWEATQKDGKADLENLAKTSSFYIFLASWKLCSIYWGVAITCSNYISWISFAPSELGEMLLVDERMAAWGVNPGNQTVMTSNFCLKRVPPMSTIHCWTGVI